MFSPIVTQSARCEAFFRYWLSKCVDGRPPSRKDIDPLVEIPNLCPNIIMIDVLPDGYRFRLVGSENTLRWGVELTGQRLDPGNPVVRDFLIPMYDQVAADWKPRTVVARMAEGSRSKLLVIMTPLVNAHGKTECLFGAVFYEGDFKRVEIEDMAAEEVEISA